MQLTARRQRLGEWTLVRTLSLGRIEAFWRCVPTCSNKPTGMVFLLFSGRSVDQLKGSRPGATILWREGCAFGADAMPTATGLEHGRWDSQDCQDSLGHARPVRILLVPRDLSWLTLRGLVVAPGRTVDSSPTMAAGSCAKRRKSCLGEIFASDYDILWPNKGERQRNWHFLSASARLEESAVARLISLNMVKIICRSQHSKLVSRSRSVTVSGLGRNSLQI